MRIFTPPKSSYDDYYEEAAFNLTWRLNVFLTFVLIIFVLASVLVSTEAIIISVINLVIPIISMIVMWVIGKYKAVAYALVVLGMIVPGVMLNVELSGFHEIEFLFMLVGSLYAFITLNKEIGLISLMIQYIWFLIYLFGVYPNSNHSGKHDFVELIAIALGLLVAMGFVGFILIEFFKLKKVAEDKYRIVNRDLSNINHLVKTQNKEKTVMLKEIHHRVKNNLQVISSLLRLQSYEVQDEISKVQFQDAIHRVSAMALIHEKMYQNENLSKINLKSYIEKLAKDLIETHAKETIVKLKIKSDLEELGNDTLVPLALILNELITNSLKHAFAERKVGEIDVLIEKDEREGFFRFLYKDDGKWKRSERPNSFGLELIATLTEQLEGEMNRDTENGTRYAFLLKSI